MHSSFLARTLERMQRFLGLRVLFVVARHLDPVAPPLDNARLTIRAMRREELNRIAADPSWDVDAEFLPHALELDGGCLGAYMGDQLAGYSWYARSTTPFESVVWVSVPDHMIYLYKLFVNPDFRGRHVAGALIHHAGEENRTPGRNHTFALCAAHNVRSLAAFRTAGHRPVGLIVYWRTTRFFLAWHSPGARRLGVRLERRRNA